MEQSLELLGGFRLRLAACTDVVVLTLGGFCARTAKDKPIPWPTRFCSPFVPGTAIETVPAPVERPNAISRARGDFGSAKRGGGPGQSLVSKVRFRDSRFSNENSDSVFLFTLATRFESVGTHARKSHLACDERALRTTSAWQSRQPDGWFGSLTFTYG